MFAGFYLFKLLSFLKAKEKRENSNKLKTNNCLTTNYRKFESEIKMHTALLQAI